MELSGLEEAVLEAFEDEEEMSLKMVATLKRHDQEGYEYDVAIGMKELNRKVLWRHY